MRITCALRSLSATIRSLKSGPGRCNIEASIVVHLWSSSVLAAPPESGLREAQGVRQLQMIQAVAAIVEEGKAQGSIDLEVDSEQVAWQLHAVWWAEDISHLMGLDQFVTAGRSSTILNSIMGRLPNRARIPDQDDDVVKLRRLLGLCPLVNPPAQ